MYRKFVKNYFTQENKKYFSSTLIKDYKQKKDHLISGYFKDGSARFVFSDISNIISNCRKRFEIYEFEKIKFLSIAYNTTILMNSFLSGEERVKLTSQFSQNLYGEENKKIISIYSESICTGEVRGFIEENILKNEDYEGELDKFLKISKILYNQKSEISGIIKLSENKLSENDIFRYFEESEQIRTYVKFNTFKNENEDKIISQGFILQKMPDCNLEILEKTFYKIINNKNFKNIFENGLSVKELEKLFLDINVDVKISRRSPIDFFCRCSLETFKSALKTLPREDVLDMKQRSQNKLKCKACNSNYILSDNDFIEILDEKKNT